jgi:hypothetical protein
MDYLSFKSALYLLLESKKELKSLLDRGKVNRAQYAGWIGRNINDTEASINHIIDLLNWFENNKSKLDDKDINKYTVYSLQSTFNKVGVSKSQKQKEIKGEGAKLIYENDEYLLYEIYNHEASCYYGSGTKWCITGKNPNNPDGGSYSWDSYRKEGAGFMFLIKKNGDMDDVYYKIAIAYTDKDNVRYILAAFNALDKQINKSTLKSITKSVNNNWDYTYFQNKKWFGDVPIDIMSTENILEKIVKGTYTIQSDGTVDVKGNVNLNKTNLTKLPVKFGRVTGYFSCSDNQLTSLEGAPQSVGNYFYCSNNKLTSLKGAPQSVGGGFYCNDNQLSSLEGAPQSVVDIFDCSHNQLTSLEGAPPSVVGSFYCNYNQLTSLEGAPQSVGGYFDCSNNKVKFTEDDVLAVSDVKGEIIV